MPDPGGIFGTLVGSNSGVRTFHWDPQHSQYSNVSLILRQDSHVKCMVSPFFLPRRNFVAEGG